jgi:cysteine desulfurase
MRSYLDHAATTAMLPQARQAWLDAAEATGNPSSLHASGRSARRVVEEAREAIAAHLRTRPSWVIFTAGGTESDNLAIKGLYWSRRSDTRTGVLASAIEHHAVLDPVQWLGEHEGADVRWLAVDHEGRVDLDLLEHALGISDVALCSVMWANNEVGTIQPVTRIAQACHDAGVPFHTDAVQALGHLPMDLSALGATAVTISSHKVGGPFGVGALILDPSAGVTPVLHGGGQEREVRSGTLDAPGIAAFAVAVQHAVDHQQAQSERIRVLRNALVAGVRAAVPGAVLNGAQDLDDLSARLPGNAHFSFPGCEGDALLMLLDAAGIDCSTGSACTAGIPEPSHVLLAMGVDERTARASLRFSLGANSTQADVDRLLAVLPGVVERAERAGQVAVRAMRRDA